MKTKITLYVLLALASISFVIGTPAQEATIPDPGLNAAIREALPQPTGPLTERALLSLTILEARNRDVKSIGGLEAASNLVALDLESNKLASVSIPAELTNLVTLDLSFNSLTNCVIPGGLTNLAKLIIEANPLTHLTLPAGLSGLSVLDLGGNQLTNLTLPPDLTELTSLFMDGDPLTSFVVSEPMAAGNLADAVAVLRNQGISVFIYPLTVQLVRLRPLLGAFQFGIVGPPGVYTVFESEDLVTWSELGITTNALGKVNFMDETAQLSSQRFYRARLAP